MKRVCCDICHIATRQLLYCTFVQPWLEYASNLWSPYTAKHKAVIENIQRPATKFIILFSLPLMSVTPTSDMRLETLKLLLLELRHEISDLTLFYLVKLKSSHTLCGNSCWGLLQNVRFHIKLFWCCRGHEGQFELTRQSFQF